MRIIIFLLSMTLLFTPLVSATSDIKKYDYDKVPIRNEIVSVDTKPVLLYQPNIVYVNENFSAIRHKQVWMSVLINKEGNVFKPNIEIPCEDSILNKIILDSVYKYTFKPAVKDGRPIFYWMWWRVNFSTLLVNKEKQTYKVTIDFDAYIPDPNEYVLFDVQSEMIYYSTPKYPRIEKNNKIEGEVLVKALVDKFGDVIKSQLAKSSGVEAFDDSALREAFKNKFKPAILNGRPVACWVVYKVDFKIEN